MSLTVSKKRLEEAIAYVQDNLTLNPYKDEILDPYKDEIIEALQYAIDNYSSQNKDAYIATLEAKVYTYEMIIAKSNFRSMLDPTRNNKPNNRQSNRQNDDRQPNKQRNNQRGNNRSSLGQRSQNRTQYRSQNGSYRPVTNRHDNGVDE